MSPGKPDVFGQLGGDCRRRPDGREWRGVCGVGLMGFGAEDV